MRRSPILLLIAGAIPSAAFAQQGTDVYSSFQPACVEAFAKSGFTDQAGVEAICACMVNEYRAAGIDSLTIARMTEAVRRDPSYQPQDESVRRAGRACLDRVMQEFNRAQDEQRAAETARRNQADVVPARYVWTAWLHAPAGGARQIEIVDDGETIVPVADGATCTIGATRMGEREERGLILIEAAREVACPGLRVTAAGVPEGSMRVTCTHSRDFRTVSGGMATFELQRQGADAKLGTLMVLCQAEAIR